MLINGAGEIDSITNFSPNGSILNFHTQPLCDNWLVSASANVISSAATPVNAALTAYKPLPLVFGQTTGTLYYGERIVMGAGLSTAVRSLSVNIAAANPGIFTTTATHNLTPGQIVRFTTKSSTLQNNSHPVPGAKYRVATCPSNTTFTISQVTDLTSLQVDTAANAYVVISDLQSGELNAAGMNVPPPPTNSNINYHGRPMGLKVIKPLTTLVAGDHLSVYQKIPISKCAALRWTNESSVTPKFAILSFWVYTNKTGRYTGTLAMPGHLYGSATSINTVSATGTIISDNLGSSYSTGSSTTKSRWGCPFTFNVSTANTWQKISITFRQPLSNITDVFDANFGLKTQNPVYLDPRIQPFDLGLTVAITLAAFGTNSTLSLGGATGTALNTPTAAQAGNMLSLGSTSIADGLGKQWQNYGIAWTYVPNLLGVGTLLENGSTVAVNNFLDTTNNHFYFSHVQLEAADLSTSTATEYTSEPLESMRRESATLEQLRTQSVSVDAFGHNIIGTVASVGALPDLTNLPVGSSYLVGATNTVQSLYVVSATGATSALAGTISGSAVTITGGVTPKAWKNAGTKSVNTNVILNPIPIYGNFGVVRANWIQTAPTNILIAGNNLDVAAGIFTTTFSAVGASAAGTCTTTIRMGADPMDFPSLAMRRFLSTGATTEGSFFPRLT